MADPRAVLAASLAGTAAGGLGEAVTILPRIGAPVTVRGIWSQGPAARASAQGIGVEDLRGLATLRIALTALPVLDRASRVQRAAFPGEMWRIDEAVLSAGIAWRLTLARQDGIAPR